MAPQYSRPAPGDIQILGDPRRSQPIHLTYVMLGFLVSGLLTPILSAPGLWRLVLGHSVYVSADGQTRSYSSLARTVADVLRESRISVGPGDRITPALDAKVWTGMQIALVRALPLTVTVGGERRQVRLPATTVGEALALMNVEMGPEDLVHPEPSTALTPGIEIRVERRETRTWVEESPIAFAVQVSSDPAVLRGQQVVKAPGQPGLRERTVQVKYADGRVIAMQTIADTVIRPPVARVIANGVKPLLATRGPFKGKEIRYVPASAYYPGPKNFGGGVGPTTAIGLMARHGVVAVDPSVIRLGTKLYIEGYGPAVAGDTGGAIKGDRIDLCFDTYDEAMQFGRRTVKLYILTTP